MSGPVKDNELARAIRAELRKPLPVASLRPALAGQAKPCAPKAVAPQPDPILSALAWEVIKLVACVLMVTLATMLTGDGLLHANIGLAVLGTVVYVVFGTLSVVTFFRVLREMRS